MRKIYFILFGVVLVILIFLVDWREKFNAITGRQPEEKSLGLPLGEVGPSQEEAQPPAEPAAAPPSSSLDSLLDAVLPGELPEMPAATGSAEADLESQLTLPSGFAAPRAINPGPGRSLSPGGRDGRALAPRFEDMPEQPYLDESRQLLRQTGRNYDRIVPPKPNDKRQP